MTHSEIREEYAKLTKALIEKQLTITLMESATGGLLASLLTDTEGASAILKGAFVTYSNEAKVMQGVPAQTIETYGVYSPNTACAMAKACRSTYQADIGIGVTGSFGNVDPNNADSIPGVVDYALDIRGNVAAYHLTLEAMGTRYDSKMQVAQAVVESLLTQIQTFDQEMFS